MRTCEAIKGTWAENLSAEVVSWLIEHGFTFCNNYTFMSGEYLPSSTQTIHNVWSYTVGSICSFREVVVSRIGMRENMLGEKVLSVSYYLHTLHASGEICDTEVFKYQTIEFETFREKYKNL